LENQYQKSTRGIEQIQMYGHLGAVQTIIDGLFQVTFKTQRYVQSGRELKSKYSKQKYLQKLVGVL